MNLITRGRLLAFTAIGLALVTAVAGAGGLVAGGTAPGQPTVADDSPAMDEAIAVTLTAAGGEAAVAVTGVVRARTCLIDRVRMGEFTRSADLYTDLGREGALIDRIAVGCPTATGRRSWSAMGG